MCVCCPGAPFWQRLRIKAQVDMLPLPDSIEDVDCQGVDVEKLEPEKINRKHRVIYVVAKYPG